MMSVVFVLIVAVFPAGALVAWKSGGDRRLLMITLAAFVLVVALGLVSASSFFGNRISATDGYVVTAARILFFYGLVGCLPMGAAAITISAAAGRKVHPAAVFAIGVGVALIAGYIGLIVALYATYN